ncbi:hypothetical protein CsSME_00052078 [Camellia sinensis var. sinensis]
MASKTLVRTGASLMNRLLNPLLQQQQKNTSSNHLIASSCLEITPMIFPPSLSKFQTSLNVPHNDSDPLKRLSFDGFLYPSGLPSLGFFLPDVINVTEALAIGIFNFYLLFNEIMVVPMLPVTWIISVRGTGTWVEHRHNSTNVDLN